MIAKKLLLVLIVAGCSVTDSIRLGLLRVGQAGEGEGRSSRELADSVLATLDAHAAFRELLGYDLSMSYPEVGISMSMSMAPVDTATPKPYPCDEEPEPEETAAPGPALTGSATFAPTPGPTAVEPMQGEDGPGGLDAKESATKSDGASGSAAPNAGQTVLTVVLACAAATVIGALVARKMYVSRKQSSSSASVSDSTLEQGVVSHGEGPRNKAAK